MQVIAISDINISIAGLEELEQSMLKAVKTYPDKAQRELELSALNLRRNVVRQQRTKVKDDSNDYKYKLTDYKAYKIDKVKGYGKNMEVDISARSPHFHLVEHGHQLVKGGRLAKEGRVTGFVPGNHVFKTAREKFRKEEMPKRAEKFLKKVTKEAGL